jgi:hypothetical protein
VDEAVGDPLYLAVDDGRAQTRVVLFVQGSRDDAEVAGQLGVRAVGS